MSTEFDLPPTQAIQDLTGDYEIDVAHSRLGFVARHAMVTSVRGQFADFAGRLHLDAEDPTRSTAQVTIQVASINTGQEQRDAHLRSPDFFDVEKYPEMTFTSTRAEQVGEDAFRLAGDLTIRDVTRPVTLDITYNGSAKDPFGNLRAGFEGRATVNRKDWNLTWNAALETGGFLVSDKIRLEFDVSAVKLTPTA
ncbi:MAG: YceI family protein [Actinomycetota bacterium]